MRFFSGVLSMALVVGLLATSTAQATCFCMLRRPQPSVRVGSSVTRDEAYSPAAAVFLVRDGMRTIMTIEAAYEGPITDLSLVIPVPHSLERGDVRTVPGSVFRNLDRRTAPKVQHVWPACQRQRRRAARPSSAGRGLGGALAEGAEPSPEDLGIAIEDEWEVDEYDITTLDAGQSAGLLTFLRGRGLELPAAAEPALRAYIEAGNRFVLVKVDPARANRVGEQMVLSPIQLDFESEDLIVPVRLGTLNSPGEQELLLYVLSADGRYEIANRPSMLSPTDLRLSPRWDGGVASFYSGLMEEMFRQHPGAGVTEYSRDLGRGVSPWLVRQLGLERINGGATDPRRRGRIGRSGRSRRYTLTRIRHRYGKDLADDLVLRPAAPIRLTRRWRGGGNLNQWTPEGRNNYHTRFVVMHRGQSCPSRAQQRWRARRYATSDQMWSHGEDVNAVWPGEVLLDRVDSLGIEPGSSAPPRPQAAPLAPASPFAKKRGSGQAIPMSAGPLPAPSPTPAALPMTPSPATEDGLFAGCSTSSMASHAPTNLLWLTLFGLVSLRRRRRLSAERASGE